MKKILLLFICSFSLFFAGAQDAQNSEETAVIAVIKTMFDGMRVGDSAIVHSVLAEDLVMNTTYLTRDGEPVLQKEPLQFFLNAIGTPHPEIWDEVIWNYDIRIDGLLANVWTEYSFYAGNNFSHCGVNDFQLFKSKTGWKIINITDTRRRSDCRKKPSDAVNELMDAWHKAAATADEVVFFNSMTEDGIYIGTDASERWTREEMRVWSKPFFERESAWAFTATERNVTVSADGQMAWFDELLETWMGVCRGSGVLAMTAEGWKIQHYHLAMAIPNDLVQDYLKVLKKYEKKEAKKKEE